MAKLPRDKRRQDLLTALTRASLGDKFPLPPHLGRMSLDEVRVEMSGIIDEAIAELENMPPAPYIFTWKNTDE